MPAESASSDLVPSVERGSQDTSGETVEVQALDWAEFEAVRADFDSRFADTRPLTLFPGSHLRDASVTTRPKAVTVAEVMVIARRNNRVCPAPEHWQRLFELLPNKKQTSRGWRPTQPLTGGGLAGRSNSWMVKRLTLREHVEWAAQEGVLDAVYELLSGLAEQDWLHTGETR